MFRLPRTLNDEWPWQREVNPHYEEVKIETEAWFQTFGPFGTKIEKAFYRANPKHLRTASDMMALMLIYDEYTDGVDLTLAREAAAIVMDAIQNPNKARPVGEIALGRVAQQFWARGVKTASVTAQRRLFEAFSLYTNAVTEEARDREDQNIRSIDDHLTIHFDSGAMPGCFWTILLPLDLPDEVFLHPVIVELSRLSGEMVVLDNEIFSYNKEQSAEEIPLHNMITILMHHDNCSVEQAMEKTAEMHRERSRQFLRLWNDLPSWDPVIDPIARKYVQGLADWETGTYYWSFEIDRYFGPKREEIYKNRIVTWLPKYNSMAP
ncbi:terpenoid synthase [Hysterangium stoloniferum]|nr:terpenoid synthase [Hysterangium stoloniferum]